MMNQDQPYRFVLQPYTDRSSRYDCPHCGGKKRFTRYIDQVTGEPVDPRVGKCDRINNCGYHYTPGEFFKDNPQRREFYGSFDSSAIRHALTQKEEERNELPRLIIDRQYLTESRADVGDDSLMKFLIDKFGLEEAMHLSRMYLIGTWRSSSGNSTIFWQVDKMNQIRGGKIIRYDSRTGHRLQHVKPKWAHKELVAYRNRAFRLDQCLYGEHLLGQFPDKPVAVVESEKTAIICASVFPEYLWLATGGLQAYTPERLTVLRGREVMAFPDMQAYNTWFEKSCYTNPDIRVFRYLETMAPEADLQQGLDLGDYVV